MQDSLLIIQGNLLEEYNRQADKNLPMAFGALTDAEISSDSFSFYTSVSSVFSSKIEGEEIELDSYIRHKKFGIEFLPDYTRKIDDLYDAYTFAKSHALNKNHLLEAHRLLSAHIVARHFQGIYRTQNMFVTTPDGKIEYVAALPNEVPGEMEKLFYDINVLLHNDLSIPEVFYFASMIHLVFVKIHPFNDGNGRCARLIEKWFLAEKLGAKAWLIQSEKHYYQHHQAYYSNIRRLGFEYTELDYSKALPFLVMLQGSLNFE